MEENLKQAIKLFNEILEWNYSFDNQEEIKPELRDKIESFIYECEKEYSEDNKVNSKPANYAIFDVSISLPSDEEIREPIQNAIYATWNYTTDQCTEFADGILTYLTEAGYKVVRQ